MKQVKFMAMLFRANLPRSVPGSSLNGPIIATLFRKFFIPMDGMQNGLNHMQITAQRSSDPE